MYLPRLGQEQPDDNEGYTVGFNHDTLRQTTVPPRHDGDASSNRDGELGGRFGSSLPGRFNAAFADGSVRPLSYDIRPVVFRRLGQINDSEVIDGGEF